MARALVSTSNSNWYQFSRSQSVRLTASRENYVWRSQFESSRIQTSTLHVLDERMKRGWRELSLKELSAGQWRSLYLMSTTSSIWHCPSHAANYEWVNGHALSCSTVSLGLEKTTKTEHARDVFSAISQWETNDYEACTRYAWSCQHGQTHLPVFSLSAFRLSGWWHECEAVPEGLVEW